MKEMFSKAMTLINDSTSIYITSHVSPDGDAVGSVFAMYLALKNMGKDVHVIMPKYSDRFKFLEEISLAEEEVDKDAYDLCVVLDCSSIDRIAMLEGDFNKAKKKLVIDHHINSKIEADLMVVDSKSPATCQMVYEFLTSQNILIDKDIAKYIYMGIVTDTGSFNYQSTTSKTHKIVADLLDTGIDFAYICKMVNDTMKENRLKLIAYAINNIETYKNGKIKYVKISNEVLKSFNISDEDAEGIVNYLRCIEGVDIAIYARELDNGTYKVSMRSNGNVDVSNAAIRLGGGGHINAAGFSVSEEIDNVIDEIIEIVGVNL